MVYNVKSCRNLRHFTLGRLFQYFDKHNYAATAAPAPAAAALLLLLLNAFWMYLFNIWHFWYFVRERANR